MTLPRDADEATSTLAVLVVLKIGGKSWYPDSHIAGLSNGQVLVGRGSVPRGFGLDAEMTATIDLGQISRVELVEADDDDLARPEVTW